MMQQEGNRQKRFALIENVKQYKVKNEQQVTDIERYIQHLRLRYVQIKTKPKNEENNKKVQMCEKKLKKLGDILGKEASKIVTHFSEHVMTVLDELILLAKQHMHPLTIQLIMSFLSPEVKCQSSSKLHEHEEQSLKIHQTNNNHHTSPQVIALPSQQESIIALPDSYNNHSLVIVNANASDIVGQQLRQQSEKFFAQDDLRVAEYLQKKFVTVDRQGISEIFMQCAEKIAIQFIQPLINDQLINKLTVDQLISCLKLVCHTNPSLYTYYLLSLLKSFSESILECFTTEQKENHKIILEKGILATELHNKIKRSEYEQIVYLIKSLAERWDEHKGEFNVKVWEWKVEQCMILTFLSSTVSEKQLYSIKTLIDRIRKTQYNSYSAVNQQLLLEFIQSHSVISKIFNPENHPEVIIKGKQVFEFVVKNLGLGQQMIDIIFQLIIKSNESVGKGLYQTLYGVGHENLQLNREYILSRINSLPRAALFYEETFNLIQALILFSPLQNLRKSLQYTYMIIGGHYTALKTHLQHKLLNIYFEVYLMGVEEGLFGDNEDDVMICLKPFLEVKKFKNEQEYELVFLIVDRFLEKLKQQLPRNFGHKCKYILNTAIKLLFNKYKIHKQSQHQIMEIRIIDEHKQKQLRKNQLELIKELLESSQKQQIVNMLPQKQLWQLIQEEPYFGRFLSFYSRESQQFLLEKLLKKQKVTQGDIKNIIEAYNFMNGEVKEKVFVNIYQLFLETGDDVIKKKLVEFVVKEGKFKGENLEKLIQEEIGEEIDKQRLLGKLMLIKQSLVYNDNLYGYGPNPPFKYLTNSHTIRIKVLNMVDVLNPMTFQVQEKHYNTLRQCLLGILPIVGKRQLTQISVRLDKAEKHATLEQLNWRLNGITSQRELLLTIQEGSQSSWYDQSLLINPKTNALNQQIASVLKQVFSHYSDGSKQKIGNNSTNNYKTGRLYKNEACKIFAIATRVEQISPHDARILHLFNNYSQIGEYLTLKEWINFYYQSALANPQLVIDNLRNLGYGEVFGNVENMMRTDVNNEMENEESSIMRQKISNNKIRQYFAGTQSIFPKLIKLSQILHNISLQNINNSIVQQKQYLIIDLIKQLPTWKQLKESVQQQFFIKNTNQQDMKQQSFQLTKTHQIQNDFLTLYIKTVFVGYLVDAQQSAKIVKVNVTKVDKYCIKVSHILYKYLTKQLQQVIDPLKLECDEQLAIWALQNVSKVLCGQKGGVKGIRQFREMMNKNISQLTPYQKGQVINFQKELQTNIINTTLTNQLFISQLTQLCAINFDLVITYCAVLLWELIESQQKCNFQQGRTVERQDSKKFLMKLLLLNETATPIIIQDQQQHNNKNHNQQQQHSQKTTDNQQLQSLSNKLVYLLIQNIHGLKICFWTNRLRQTIKEITAYYHDLRVMTRSIGYFQTLNQMVILENDEELLSEVYQQLLRMVEFMVKENDSSTIYDHNRQEKNILQTQQKLVQNILACIKNVIMNIKNKHKINLGRPITLCQRLLINHQLSSLSQLHCYEILSSATENQSNSKEQFLTTTAFLNTILSTVTLKKNSKPNTEQNQSQCGIYNLGCICYINSVFQQLYHVDQFKRVAMETLMIKQQQEQMYFKQFRKVFYQLTYSHRQFITTEEFCHSYTDCNNQPINIKEQHDADQFLNQLLDRLQKTYQFTYQIPKHQIIINKLFQGTMSNVITCQNCFTNKVNQEEFYILSLEIKNLSTLKECLDKMVESEVICDYFCTVCDKKVGEIQKYRKFSSLPKILFIHFQRLVFDLESFSKVKLENPVNFAQEIDLSQYFYQSLSNDQCAKYRLLGFIVHFGNSQGGHYISLIKNKQGKGGWRKYDDSRITKWFWKTGIHEKDNAYLLIYERIQADDKKQDLNELQVSNMPLSKKLIQQINEDNVQLNKQLIVTKEQFCRFFIKELYKQEPIIIKWVNSQSKDKEERMEEELLQQRDIQLLLRCKLIWKYLSIVEQAKSIGLGGGNEQLTPMIRDSQLDKLCKMFIEFNTLSQSAEYFLNIIVEQQALRLLYKPGQKKLRETFKWILTNVIVQWCRFRQTEEGGIKQALSFLVPSIENQTIRKLLWQVENLLSQVGKSSTKMDEYFEFLLLIIKLVPKIKEYFQEMNIVPKLVHFIMHKESKLMKEIGHCYPLGTNGKKIPCFNVIIDIIGVYVESYSEDILHEKKVRKCLGEENLQFYKKLFSQRYENYHQINNIIVKFCHKSLRMTNKVIDQFIIPNLNRFNHQDSYVVSYIDLAYMLLKINDEEAGYRMHRMLGIPTLKDVLSGEGDTMVKKKNQRIVGYWSNLLMDSDEIMFPLLELLYSNRQNINYFELSGIMCLLKLMTEKDEICKYVMMLPSPCFAYENYLTWIRHEFLKNAIKQLPSMKLQKIDLKQCLNKIGRMLQEIDNKVTELLFIDERNWMGRNSQYLFGEITQKLETRLITVEILQKSRENSIIKIPLTYTILKTCHVTNWPGYAKEVLDNVEIIQPHEQYEDQKVRRSKFQTLLKENYCRYDKSDSKLLQLWFSGDNQQLLPYRGTQSVVKMSFSYPQYSYDVFISIQKLINSECKLIVPCPQKCKDEKIQNSEMDKLVSGLMNFEVVSGRDKKITQGDIKEKHSEKEIIHSKEEDSKYQQGDQHKNNEFNTKNSLNQTMAVMNDAFIQQTQNANSNNQNQVNNVRENANKQEICIQCPFCGYITHEFASRCPGCNEEWGLYA